MESGVQWRREIRNCHVAERFLIGLIAGQDDHDHDHDHTKLKSPNIFSTNKAGSMNIDT